MGTIRLFLGLFLLTAHSAIGSDSSGDSASRERTDIGLTADLRIILQDRSGRSSNSEHRFYKSGMLVRIEPPPAGPADPNLPDGQKQAAAADDVYIYDYAKRKQYRLIPSSKIYFETTIAASGFIEAQREGWIPWQESSNIEAKKIKLAETTFDGHPCQLYLEVKSLMSTEGSKRKKPLAVEYSLLWEATDLENLPVRIVYTGPDYVTKIIEYRAARMQKADPALFRPPGDFRGLSPF
jgi:hypothetical protein